jgi:hypothetical protein
VTFPLLSRAELGKALAVGGHDRTHLVGCHAAGLQVRPCAHAEAAESRVRRDRDRAPAVAPDGLLFDVVYLTFWSVVYVALCRGPAHVPQCPVVGPGALERHSGGVLRDHRLGRARPGNQLEADCRLARFLTCSSRWSCGGCAGSPSHERAERATCPCWPGLRKIGGDYLVRRCWRTGASGAVGPDGFVTKLARPLPLPNGTSAAHQRGQYMMTATPARQSAPPRRSKRSGAIRSIAHPQKTDKTTNTPPYAAYTRPK